MSFEFCLLAYAAIDNNAIHCATITVSVSVNILKFGGHRIVVSALPGFAWLCLALPGFAWLCLALPLFAFGFAALAFLCFGSFRPTQVEAICMLIINIIV